MNGNIFRNLTSGIKLKRKKPVPNNVQDSDKNDVNSSIIDDEEEFKDETNPVRKKNRIQVFGEDVPDPVSSFHEIVSKYKINEAVCSNLKESGFNDPTPVQMQAIPLMMERRELITSAPTGSGKTLAFLLPIITQLKGPKNIGFRALILSPTWELAKQTHREFLSISNGTGLRIHMINDLDKFEKKFAPGSKINKDIVITTPKRLLKLLSTDPPSIDLKHLRWLVIDECDKLFEKSLRDQLATIYNEVSKGKNVTRAMFSATFNDELEKWFQMNLDNVVTLIVGGKNVVTENIDQHLQFVGSEDGKLMALKTLISKGLEAPVLIFVDEKEKGRKLFSNLIVDGINVEVIHSDRIQSQRDKIVSSFREGKILFLICTELMGRGIDFKAVNTVINYDLPSNPTSYIHKIGRVGRAGRKGKAITFFTESDLEKLNGIINVMKRSGCEIPEFLQKKVTERSKHRKSDSQKKTRNPITDRKNQTKRKSRKDMNRESFKRKKMIE